jgi:hypothetical protein
MSCPLPHEEDEENAQEELSDEQIQQLLKEATTRLAEAAQHDQRVSTPTQKSGRLLPKLQTTTSHASYIREVNGIATADPKLLISEEQRKLSENLRSVETAGHLKRPVSTPHNSYQPFT